MRKSTKHNISQQKSPLPTIRFRDEKNNLRKELLTSEADTYAERFGNPSEGRALTNHQIRRFYNEVKALEAKIEATQDFAGNEALVHMLKAKVAYARNKSGQGKVPEEFKQFIDDCVDAIDKAENKKRGFSDFVKFFEAIIGFTDLKEK